MYTGMMYLWAYAGLAGGLWMTGNIPLADTLIKILRQAK